MNGRRATTVTGPGDPDAPVPWTVHVLVHVTGVVATLVVSAVCFVGLAFVSFGTSVCNAKPRPGARVELVVAALVAGAALVATTGLVALVARRSRTVAWPWLALAAAFAVATGLTAARIHPSQVCLF